MDANSRITSMLGTAPLNDGGAQAGPAAKGKLTPYLSAISTNGKMVTRNVSLLAQTLEDLLGELQS